MPEFQLGTSGQVCRTEPRSYGTASVCTLWGDLDAFTQGYVEALFFTESGGEADGKEIGDAGFADLDPDALAKILADCAKFQDSRAWVDTLEGHQGADEEHAGRDFWYTRNGHGCGFWDGDWPEPYATQLTDAAKAFGEVSVYLGDDGKVYLDL